MIRFYRRKKCSFCDKIAAKLEELVVAHEVFELPAASKGQDDEVRIEEGRRNFQSESDILEYLYNLERELIMGREMQSDSCVIGPDGACL